MKMIMRPNFGRTIHAAVLAALALALCSCQTAPKPPVAGWKEIKQVTFAIWIPHEMEVGLDPGPDFNYCYFYEPPKGDEKPPTLYVYEGLSPKRFAPDKEGLVTKRSGPVRFGSFQGTEAAGQDAKGNYWREMHLQQPEQMARLHIWYFGTPKDKAETFDAIIHTLRAHIKR